MLKSLSSLTPLSIWGGEGTVNFVRRPMWFGTGKGGKKNPKDLKENLGKPSRTTRQKEISGYTTQSGAVKQDLNWQMRHL